MSEDLPNLDLLIKCLKMTHSTNDGQALVAMRKANEQLLKFGGDWETLLRGKVKIIADPFASINIPNPRSEDPYRRGPHVPPPPPPPPVYTPQRPTPTTPPRPAAPPPPPPTPTPDVVKPFNQFAGRCTKCNGYVGPGDGEAFKRHGTGRWLTRHKTGQCPPPSQRRTKSPTTIDDIAF